MVSMTGQLTQRLAPAVLRLPDKFILDRMPGASGWDRNFEELKHYLDYGVNGHQSFQNDEYLGRLIKGGAKPERRSLVLI
jgi:hypothetical protein